LGIWGPLGTENRLPNQQPSEPFGAGALTKPPSDPARLIRIGLILDHHLRFFREIILGVREYAAEHPNWQLIPFNEEVQTAVDAARHRAKRRLNANSSHDSPKF
jgi:hypothetical protein